ncbi:hypothetical protein [Amycolatopsis sp. 195334CR]|uniref:hypothetical protein n=1 Tax=Amycolatopsis sp. 195334CR TaxID=2814588 RepID=UPI001A8F34E9|nr:hypothetical protein [Amycolatopsis sp. 195334CR]MBN6040508.1 hypothetical protein [Amycolatopsis sp. 195334CR]
MISLDDVLHALPLRDLRGDVGTKHSRKGGATALLDLEPAAEFEAVDAIPEKIRTSRDALDFPELVPMCFEYIVLGVRTEFEERFGTPAPPVRVVVREVLPHPVEANELNNRYAGRRAVRSAFEDLVAAKVAVGDQCLVPALALRWYDDEPQPGLVEVVLYDRHHNEHQLIDKVPYFEAKEDVLPESSYPLDVGVPVVVREIHGDTAIVQSFHHVDDEIGEYQRFEVRSGRLY